LIYHLSTEGFGSSFTELWLSEILGLFQIHISHGNLAFLNFVVRKLAHFTEYAIFAQLLYVSLLGADDLEWQPHTAFWSAVIAGAYSLSDEFHQLFVPNRTASLVDCAIDTTGAILGLLAVYIVAQRLQANRTGAAAGEAGALEA
jgi:hypothetical protein